MLWYVSYVEYPDGDKVVVYTSYVLDSVMKSRFVNDALVEVRRMDDDAVCEDWIPEQTYGIINFNTHSIVYATKPAYWKLYALLEHAGSCKTGIEGSTYVMECLDDFGTIFYSIQVDGFNNGVLGDILVNTDSWYVDGDFLFVYYKGSLFSGSYDLMKYRVLNRAKFDGLLAKLRMLK